MERSTKSELVQQVETQREQLKKYENKLRDVVRAYKSLQKEKVALEESLTALSSSGPYLESKPGNEDSPSQTEPSRNEDDADNAGEDENRSVSVDPLQVEQSATDTNAMQLKEKLATLTSALATVTQEKSRMENNYQADKKKLKQELDELTDCMVQQKEEYEKQINILNNRVKELTTTLRTQQSDRDKEQIDHSMMLREMQKLLANERILKENLEHQLEQAHTKLVTTETMLEQSKQQEEKVRILSGDLEKVRQRLNSSEERAKKPSPLMLELQREMAELKAQHRITMQREQQRANEAEQRLGVVAAQSETRVSSLETRLSELSDIVGGYDRDRQHDQAAIHKLKERISQLDLENSALARRVTQTDASDDDDASNLDVNALIERIAKLKGMLKQANARSERPVNLSEVLGADSDHGELGGSDWESIHSNCQQEYRQLKEEFERYKLRAQSVLKNKRDSNANKETTALRAQISELKERVHACTRDCDAKLHQSDVACERLRASAAAAASAHADKLRAAETSYARRTAELEDEMSRQRERTLALLAEKDDELAAARRRVAAADDDDVPASPSGDLAALRLDGPLLLFSEEAARRDVEIGALREAKRRLERALHELRREAAADGERRREEAELLVERLRGAEERARCRGDASLEYLKNVVYSFMVSGDAADRRHMLNAIATVLEFSVRERDAALHALAAGWWGATTGTPSSGKR
ncbi:PREDICTED: GRIP and coiled-coil domain-containing protein 1-like [Priapulus caudatus]|uniref:GRIP and coiled-coil domain-containing protein 1-like n=1 Tax=Priapulus caudatus TaxID=37621 RepID=A0ABM1EN43_PRICU|nr:PREDICTED: GRIP and coiled-coil domain-containing protein 1-like [Priapulus caudatus]